MSTKETEMFPSSEFCTLYNNYLKLSSYFISFIAKLSSSSSPVELSTALILIISTNPPPPTPG